MERELTGVLQKAGAAGYGRGYSDAATAGRSAPHRTRTARRTVDPATRRRVFSTTQRSMATCGDTTTGSAVPVGVDAAVRRHQVSYVKEVTAVDDRAQAEFRDTARRAPGPGSEAVAARGARGARRGHGLSEMRRYAAAGGRRRCSTGRRWETAGGMSGRAGDELETLTVTGETPTVRAIWIPGWRWSRNAVMRATMRTEVARGCRWGRALRSARPSRPSA